MLVQKLSHFLLLPIVWLVLQDVLRNWHSREARIIRTMSELVANAEKAADAFRNGTK